jgi:hypothetical protein
LEVIKDWDKEKEGLIKEEFSDRGFNKNKDRKDKKIRKLKNTFYKLAETKKVFQFGRPFFIYYY